MSYELIADVHVCRKLWSDELDNSFNPVQLECIKNRYDRAMRMNAVYRALCDEQHKAYCEDILEFRKKIRMELSPLNKRQVIGRTGNLLDTRLTKDEMITSYAFTKATDVVESHHSRVKRIWESMTDEQKEGL